MELRQLTYFVGVAEAGSFSRAAATLHVAQPALSRQIGLLEKELGVELLVRNGRGAVPTAAGEQFLRRATDILRNIDEAKWQVASLASAPSGTLRIGIPLSVSKILTPSLFDAASKAFPHITLQVSEAWTGHIHRNLLDRKLDFGVISDHHIDSKMTYHELSMENVHIIGAPNKTPKGSALHFSELAKMPLVLPPRQHGMRIIVDDIFQRHATRPRIVLESEVWAIIIDVVQKGIAYTLFPPREFFAEIAAGHLRSVPIVKPSIPSGLCLARLSSASLPPHADHVFDFIARKLKAMIRAESQKTRAFFDRAAS